MGMMESLSRMFGGKPKPSAERAAPAGRAPVPSTPVEVVAPAPAPGDDDAETVTATVPTARTDDAPIASVPAAIRRIDENDAEELDDNADTSLALNTRKGKGEMLNQLRKNYDEVLGIVRKVDDHLDEQARRSERMLEIAERTAKHLESLGATNQQTAEAVTQLVEVTKQGNADAQSQTDRLAKTAAQQLEAQQQQTSTLHQVQASIHKSTEIDRELADSIHGFTDTIGGVKKATTDLGESITAMRETDAERERELATLVARSQRWLIVTVVVVGVVAVGALIAVIIGAF
jgi:methyl-accepting chemotaxis protein